MEFHVNGKFIVILTLTKFPRLPLEPGFRCRARVCSNEGEKALVYAATKSPHQALTRSINYPKV